MQGRNLATGLMTLLLLTAATVPVVGQGSTAPQSVLLDQNSTHIATITVDGTQYSVYRHENVFPWASGIGIYTNGERVTSPSTAETVLTALAQRRAVKELGPDDVTALRMTSRNVSRSTPNVSAAATSINETLTYLTRMQSVRKNGTTVYNASVEAAPRITEFNDTARELLPELRAFENDSAAYRSNATALVELLEKRENGTDVDPQRLYAQYVATLEAKEELSDHFGFGGIDEELSVVASTSEAIARNVSSVPERGAETAQHFREVQNESAVAANQTATLGLSDFEFDDVEDRAESLEDEWMEEWNSRRKPASTVFDTLGGIAIVIAGVAGYFGWRRR